MAPDSASPSSKDIATARDAERIAALGVPSVQINTDGGCHLEANLVARALESLRSIRRYSFRGKCRNLVCPAEFDIDEDMKVAVSSVPEGADKPLNNPLLFSQAKAVLLTKTDLCRTFRLKWSCTRATSGV
jgi:hydrogenase nickel incorporation protein HypB